MLCFGRIRSAGFHVTTLEPPTISSFFILKFSYFGKDSIVIVFGGLELSYYIRVQSR